ncbi:hypothetical protein N9Z53_03960 [Mariniblastus sp.]|nr:hypothetical protein [bacterium]MDB4372912.1 hypothetical protein [Mariniblastus sp.]
MGVDITACEGVLATVEDIFKIVDSKNKQQVLDYWHKWYDENETIRDYGDEEMCGFVMKDTFEPPAATNASMLKIGVIRTRLKDLVNVDGTGLDTGVVFAEEVHNFFEGLLEKVAPKLPYLEGVEAWGSSRYNGYEVPKGVACFVFDVESCFKRVPTAAGKKLKEIIGDLDVTSWSNYSV